jgi:hypothetical protein
MTFAMIAAYVDDEPVGQENDAAQVAYASWGWRKVGLMHPFPDAPIYDTLVVPLAGRVRTCWRSAPARGGPQPCSPALSLGSEDRYTSARWLTTLLK